MGSLLLYEQGDQVYGGREGSPASAYCHKGPRARGVSVDRTHLNINARGRHIKRAQLFLMPTCSKRHTARG